MSPARLVLGIGEVLWDNLPAGRQLGGAPANFAYHVAAQGIAAAPVSAVGHDADGQALLAALRQRGVETAYIPQVDHQTGAVDVRLDANGKPTYDIRRGVAWDHILLTEETLVAARAARAACYGSLAQRHPDSRRTIRALLEAAGRDCVKVFDVNLRPPFYDAEVLRAGLAAASVFKLSDEEVPVAAELVGLPPQEEAFGEAVIERFGLDLLVVTHGGAGSVLRTPRESHRHPGVKVEVVSTVGAGDSFTAAVVAGLLKGLPLAELHDLAARVAAYVCTQPGAMPELPRDLRLTEPE